MIKEGRFVKKARLINNLYKWQKNEGLDSWTSLACNNISQQAPLSAFTFMQITNIV